MDTEDVEMKNRKDLFEKRVLLAELAKYKKEMNKANSKMLFSLASGYEKKAVFSSESDGNIDDKNLHKYLHEKYSKYHYQEVTDFSRINEWSTKGTKWEPKDNCVMEMKQGNNDDKFILLLDGTGNSMKGGKYYTNIARMKGLFQNSGYQNVKYFSGPGTRGNFFEKLEEKITAEESVGEIIKEAYSALCKMIQKKNCKSPKIYIFGFSRGSFCALSLSNLIRLFGIVEKDQDFNKLFRVYEEFPVKKQTDIDSFNGKKVEIEFLGLFDCVSSILRNNRYHLDSSRDIKKVSHFCSLNEKRLLFFPHRPKDESNNVTTIWYLGDHSDIGGGHTKDGNDNPLSNISLTEMINHSGLILSKDVAKKANTILDNITKPVEIHDESKKLLYRTADFFEKIGTVNRKIEGDDSIHPSVKYLINNYSDAKESRKDLNDLDNYLKGKEKNEKKRKREENDDPNDPKKKLRAE